MTCKPKCKFLKETIYVNGEPVTPGGTEGSLQFNVSGEFAGSSNLTYDPNVSIIPGACEFPDEPKYKAPNPSSLNSHLTAIQDDICWARQNLVRYTDTISPSENPANHPSWAIEVATTGDDLNGRGTVAAPFATPHRAMDALHRYNFPRDATPTIQVAAGTYSSLLPLNMSHASGITITLVGVSYSTTILEFVSTGVTNGNLKNIRLNGSGAAGAHGTSYSNSRYYDLDNVIINNFNNGISVYTGAGVALRNTVTTQNNTNSGLTLNYGLVQYVSGTFTTTGNLYGVIASNSCGVYIPNSVITNNTSIGVLARWGAHVYRPGATVSGNGTDYSPAIGIDGNGNAHIT